MDGTAKQCKVYNSEGDNTAKLDSCYIEKLRTKIQCPVVNGSSPEATAQPDYSDRSKLMFFQCQYPYELGMPDRCFEKKSIYAYADRAFPGWQTRGTDHLDNQLCDNYIKRREESRAEANRLQAEQKAREAAEAKARAEADARARAEADLKKRMDEASRLQQQLDEANRRLQSCKT
jgi:hypothetical protein